MFDVNSQIWGEAMGRREANKEWAAYVAELQAQIASLQVALGEANERFTATQAHHEAVRAVLEVLPAESVDPALTQVYEHGDAAAGHGARYSAGRSERICGDRTAKDSSAAILLDRDLPAGHLVQLRRQRREGCQRARPLAAFDLRQVDRIDVDVRRLGKSSCPALTRSRIAAAFASTAWWRSAGRPAITSSRVRPTSLLLLAQVVRATSHDLAARFHPDRHRQAA